MSTAVQSIPGDLIDHVAPASRVLIVSGSYGAGHDRAAEQIRLRLQARGCDVVVRDVVTMFPFGIGRLLRDAYLAQIRLVPQTWEWLLNRLERGRGDAWLANRVMGLSAGRLLAEAADKDVVISTHPFPAQALGPARLDGRLRATLLTYLTDMSVHPIWVHSGVDLHLALHDVAAEQARACGGRTVVIEPLLPAPVGPVPVTVGSATPAGMPVPPFPRPYAVVCGGSLGIGDLERTAVDLLSIGVLTPVVMCGSNERLRRRLARRPGVLALGWRDDVTTWMFHADLVVANSGGFMTKEALSVGTPMVSYRCLPGHGSANAAAMERAGQAPWARDEPSLARVVRAVVTSPGPAIADEPVTRRVALEVG